MTTKTEGATITPMQGRSLWQDAWARFRRNRFALICTAVFLLIVAVCLLGPLFCPWDPAGTDLELKAKPPGTFSDLDGEPVRHWLGTDTLGRDVLARMMLGGRISLMVGAIATLVALVIGVTYGAVSGYFGGRIDDRMMRAVEILRALPFLIFVILLTTMFGRELWLIYLSIGAIEWLTMARIVRTQVLGISRQEYVDAARSLGLSTPVILFRHIIPNVLGPVIVYATLTVPAVMLLEAGLSFLGLGVQPPQSSWGTLIADGSDQMETYPWLLIGPAAVFSLTLFCLNFAGDGLRDALDVRSSKD